LEPSLKRRISIDSDSDTTLPNVETLVHGTKKASGTVIKEIKVFNDPTKKAAIFSPTLFQSPAATPINNSRSRQCYVIAISESPALIQSIKNLVTMFSSVCPTDGRCSLWRTKPAMRVTMNCTQCDKIHEAKFVLARIILLGSGQEGA
jgi:hypothetical protein